MRMRFAIPRLESGKRAKNIGRRCYLLNDRRKTGKDLLRDRHETREHFGSRVALVPPAELGPHGRRCGGHRDLLAFRRGDGFGDGAHKIEAAMREGAFALKRFDAFGPFAANVALGLGAAACRKFERIKKGGRRFHPALPERGGREWESNPPKTGSRPPPDLKSGRPTGDASLPELAGDGGSSAGRRNRSRRCLFMRRRSPRRMVTPWRSKNSRIWMATLRPLSSRSRNSAAANWPFGASAASADAISTMSATVSRRKK